MLSRNSFWGMVVVLLVVASCTAPGCHVSRNNQILGKNEYNSKEYQAELYRLIKESPEVDYYYEMREEYFGQNYLVVTAYGDAFCGKLCLLIAEEDIQEITQQDSLKRQGAQLIGLRYREQKTDFGRALVYEDLEYMVD